VETAWQKGIKGMQEIKKKQKWTCGCFSVGGPGTEGTYQAVRLNCKSWSCAYCGPRRARRLKRSIVEQSQLHGLDRFLTLTLDPKKGTPEESWDRIKKAWAKFRVSLARKVGKGFQYLWVVEAQKNGYAHLHILIDRYVPQAWIKHAWDAVGGGSIVHIERSDVRKSGPYLAKYLTKGFNEGLKVGQRRYGSSRGVFLGVKSLAAKGTWVLIKTPLEALRDLALAGGGVLGEVFDPETGVLRALSLQKPLWVGVGAGWG
jgi:hypothetical protein